MQKTLKPTRNSNFALSRLSFEIHDAIPIHNCKNKRAQGCCMHKLVIYVGILK